MTCKACGFKSHLICSKLDEDAWLEIVLFDLKKDLVELKVCPKCGTVKIDLERMKKSIER